ncbi:monosaccharide ABC transporter ATP-binding protein, CUT2 family [Cupriavidus sp. YR651]|uniref:sugar ABC transporter ATP-binding protein n=1 Tax=Cupriavidus sp. YR651 TaxID=1855315 RepID=UPI00088E8204|nr:sugar ABC transporter ATP-binding protein [Cupriavidus sp. YR651]SDC97617.1 monosaccharide ABC transporter ATP-binding protein, CUT2 family [Cupriavidus sp. YR651]
MPSSDSDLQAGHGGAAAPLLALRNISKTFPGVKALSNVELTAWPGEVHALMGENGAGKSTLMKILSGAYIADPGGECRIGGDVVHIDGPQAARELGVAVIYQEFSLAPNLTVAENIYLGRHLHRRGVVDRAGMARACVPTLERLGADFTATTTVADLSIAQRQLVEIARAVHFEARILVMDEPTTPLSTRETDRLFALIRKLRSEGLAILYISHRMAEIDELADRVTVLRDGCYVGTIDRAHLSQAALVKMMVGRDLSGFYARTHEEHPPHDKPVLTVRDVADGRRVRGCSFDLHAGEVLGLAGLVGAGRTELARLVFGADPRKAGEVCIAAEASADSSAASAAVSTVPGALKPLPPGSPRVAIDAGMVYLTEDRKLQGLFLDQSVHENINLIVASRDAKGLGRLNRPAARERTRAAIGALGIRVAHAGVNVGALSGGNQQKVMLSRLLEIRPRVLILDEPTRGVDIGAKSEIYRLIGQLAASGVAILLISSELPEVVALCDRVLVMREGELAGEVRAQASAASMQEHIIALATGAPSTAMPAGAALH